MLVHSLSGSNAFTLALAWLEASLVGTMATTVGAIVIASFGFLMLTGRFDIRRAAQVIVGCFIIFGASTIAGGIFATLRGEGGETGLANTPAPPQLPPPPVAPQVAATPSDPYAGAALPPR